MLPHIYFIVSAKDVQQSLLLKLLKMVILKFTVIHFCLKPKLDGTINKMDIGSKCKIENTQYF